MAEEQATQTPTISVQRPLDGDVTKWIEQFNEELIYLEHDFKGEYLDQSGDTPKWVGVNNAVLNDKGIRYIIGEIRSIANKNTFLSNLEERDRERVYDILVSILNTITDNLLYNHRTYDLDYRNFDSIVEKCANILEFAIRRPLLAGERRFLKDTSTEHRIVNTGPVGQAAGGLMSIFKRR